jgi:hypothetical protein
MILVWEVGSEFLELEPEIVPRETGDLLWK